MKKIFALILVFVQICLVSLGCGGGCYSSKCSSQGSGEDFAFTNFSALSSRPQYEYNEDEKNYWDFYSLDYEINSFGADYLFSTNLNNTSDYTLVNVSTIKVNGHMAHHEGLYYLRETYPDTNDGIELLHDATFNKSALKFIGSNWFNNLYTESEWITGGSELSEFVDYFLTTCNHFYDYEFLDYYNLDSSNYTTEDKTYILNEEKALKENYFMKWFWGIDDYGKKITSYNQITANSATLNLETPTQPVLEFSLTAYFESINKSVTCNGKLNYNYVNNTIINIPNEVLSAWQEDENYTRKLL